jgi:hypothetical protein
MKPVWPVRLLSLLGIAACGGQSIPPPPAAAGDAAAAPVTADAALAGPEAAAFTDVVVTFHLNVQDFSYPAESIAIVTRALDLHERLGIPVDVYLTTWMVDLYQTQAPALLSRLFNSPVVNVCYHTRPPVPYRANFMDWLGLAGMTEEARRATIRSYETHGLDLKMGTSTTAEGGYGKLARLYGRPPPVVGDEADNAVLQASVDAVFKELGASFAISHGKNAMLGETRNGLYIAAEQRDVKLFTTDGSLDGDLCVEKTTAAEIFECERAACLATAGLRPPCVMGIKMHDNDFFAEDSAWLTVYGQKGRPPWNTNLKSALLTEAAQAAMWKRYEDTVTYAAGQKGRTTAVGIRELAARLGVTLR